MVSGGVKPVSGGTGATGCPALSAPPHAAAASATAKAISQRPTLQEITARGEATTPTYRPGTTSPTQKEKRRSTHRGEDQGFATRAVIGTLRPTERRRAIVFPVMRNLYYSVNLRREPSNGAEGSRTPDLCSAIAALSQLSYSPGRCTQRRDGWVEVKVTRITKTLSSPPPRAQPAEAPGVRAALTSTGSHSRHTASKNTIYHSNTTPAALVPSPVALREVQPALRPAASRSKIRPMSLARARATFDAARYVDTFAG
jgi:hypothetical protein